MPTADADAELASELRDPNLLQNLDQATENGGSTTIATPVRSPNKPVVIKGSDSIPEIPQPTTPAPNPPIAPPTVPTIDANPTKTPASEP